MQDIKCLNLDELGLTLKEWGGPVFHSRQVAEWIYQKRITSFDLMTNLPQDLRRRLKEEFFILSAKVAAHQESEDGSEKFLLEYPDGNCVEAVSIPVEGRVTGCLSTQAGCKYACAFCASGMSGFKRNLSCGEMLEEALLLSKINNLVFMGTGEPLDNYDNVFKAVRIINSPQGLNIGARHITISTCGLIPGIKRMAKEGLQVELSVSLHAANDRLRSKIMPVNKKYPLKELIRACKEYIKTTNRQITFEYVLMGGLNSGLSNAQELTQLIKEVGLAKVNLISANQIKEYNISPPSKIEFLLFKDYLLKHGVVATLRKSRGTDIDAACGQLRLKYEK